VIATAVGGTAEVARFHTGLHLMSPEASPEEFARVVASLALGCKDPPSPRPTELILRQESVEAPRPLKIFSRQRMAARYHWFYRRAIAASQRLTSATGVWLVTNNFSTGGAQSSARRLLEGLAGRGIKVRAAVVQENPEDPTPGHQRLAAAGIRILALPPVGQMNPRHAVETLLEAIDRDPPAVVFYWNLIPEYKVLLTDALLRTPVFDISPGEMFYASLERYFQGPNRWESYWTARDYGARLEGVVVKYAAEATRALQCLGARVHIIPNGIPLSPPESRYFITTRIQPDPNRPFLLGTVARIHPHKRLEDLLLALKMAQPDLPSWRLQIAGGIDPGCEDYGRQLKNMAMDMPVDWLGEQSELASHHRNWDLFVLIAEPAGCPNASLEAMAAGLPVLATDAGGMAEQVVDGVTGRLTPARQPALLARALIEVIEHPSRLATMARAARKHIEARFSLDRMVKDYLELIVG
ncbi:MAG TPA: glycosyltransferase family 4 protein, partial [Candidatus Paceibacterota bacterium]|nr:glycosyltransferase family 4 protein [Candidatus Paceibacterota bacterium]